MNFCGSLKFIEQVFRRNLSKFRRYVHIRIMRKFNWIPEDYLKIYPQFEKISTFIYWRSVVKLLIRNNRKSVDNFWINFSIFWSHHCKLF